MHQTKSKVSRQADIAGSRDIYHNVIAAFVQRIEFPGFDREYWLGNLRAGNYDELLDAADSLSSTVYLTATHHFVANQLAALVRKFPFTREETPKSNPDAKALEKFISSEHKCKRQNSYLRVQRRVWTRYAPYKEAMRVYVERLFGKLDYLKIYDKCDFGPGASIGVHGIGTNLARKLTSVAWSVSPSAAKYFKAAMWRNFHIVEYVLHKEDDSPFCIDKEIFDTKVQERLAYVGYNKLSFVPKTARCSRTIAIEPLGNSFVQKGVDNYLRDRLLFVSGIDLTDQKRNQTLAYAGSLGGRDPYVTIDLSSASDSICVELCRDLLPSEWYLFLNEIRSPSYIMDGKEYPYHKFCSMGNGFCFPLETAIFVAACHAVCKLTGSDDDFSVYGDDIIIRQSKALLLLELLKALGFEANPEKTFIYGPFRESCGEDYFGGKAVRPIILDERLDSIESLIKVHNQLSRNENLLDLAEHLKLYNFVPFRKRYMRYLPGQSDTAFEVPKDVFMSSAWARWNRDTQTWSWKELLHVGARDPISRGIATPLLMMAALRGSSPKAPFTYRRKTVTRVRYC